MDGPPMPADINEAVKPGTKLPGGGETCPEARMRLGGGDTAAGAGAPARLVGVATRPERNPATGDAAPCQDDAFGIGLPAAGWTALGAGITQGALAMVDGGCIGDEERLRFCEPGPGVTDGRPFGGLFSLGTKTLAAGNGARPNFPSSSSFCFISIFN